MTASSKKNKTPDPVKKGTPVAGKKQESMRETVEAVAIAFILAFVFKTFEAEAFVIPTGSMAPTLFGRHKEVTCSGCQYFYTVGASQEIDQDSGILVSGPARVSSSECPNCRYNNSVIDAPVFNGDRIVVNKEVAAYKRFDVVVFKNPEEPHVNYIKRLVGLPGEIVRIRQGDIQVRRADTEPWVTQRKDDPWRQRDIQLLVYDDRHPPRPLLEAGAEERWVPSDWNESDLSMGGWPMATNAWQPDSQTRSYRVDTTDSQLHWLRYRHLVPSPQHWNAAKAEGIEMPQLEPQLIADFCGFNCENRGGDETYWVNDLTLDCTVKIESTGDNAQLLLELVEGFRTVRCQIDPVSGNADIMVISRESGSNDDAQPIVLETVQTEIQGAGEYTISFANVDDRLCLWVNNDLIPLAENAEFQTPGLNLPTSLDLAPAGIAASNLRATVTDLVLRRDIYYRGDVLNFVSRQEVSQDPNSDEYRWQYHDGSATISEVSSRYRLESNLRSPENYAQEYETLIEEQEETWGEQRVFRLRSDEYLMFGDNSPASKDSRLFDYFSRPLRGIHSSRFAVREQDLIGEALFIFWPHGIPFMNNGRGYCIIGHKRYESVRNEVKVVTDNSYPLYSIPFYPNISRMKWIR